MQDRRSRDVVSLVWLKLCYDSSKGPSSSQELILCTHMLTTSPKNLTNFVQKKEFCFVCETSTGIFSAGLMSVVGV